MTDHLMATVPRVADLLTGWRLVTSIVGILVLAALAGRLLGTRRSLGAVVVSGLSGWMAGAGLAVILARNHEHGQAGFLRNLWLFSAFFTMSATVWIEMMARPGALARAQHSLTSVPRPMRTLRLKSQRLARYAQITRLAARHGLGRSLGIAAGEGEEMSEGRAPLPVRVRRALEDAGGMFVKLGQALSTRADLVPAEFIAELARLQDQVSPAPRPAVEQTLNEALGRPLTEVFSDFDWRPIAAASIGQAYRAELQSGEAVIVKVQRPGIAAAVERDLDVLGQLVHTFESHAPWAVEYRVAEVVEEFAARLREELDYRVEARNATEIAARLSGLAGVRIPKVYQELTSPRVLVMEWLDGASIRHANDDHAAGRRGVKLAELLLRCSLQQMLIDGHFHADPHPGNVLLLKSGEIGLIDFGAAGRLDPIAQAALRQMMVAVAQQDPALLRQAILEVASIHRGFDDDQFERALARFISRHLGAGAKPSAAMFNELLQLMFSFQVVLPAEFSTFFRALVTLEGTLTTLSPGYQVIDAAERIATEWARERLEPATVEEFARAEVIRLAPILRRLPRHLDRLATIVERGDLRARVSLLSIDEDVRVLTRLVNRVVLAFLGGVVGVISVILIGIKGGPEFTGKTSLYEFFGYFGLFCSTVLVMRVLVAILQDGLN